MRSSNHRRENGKLINMTLSLHFEASDFGGDDVC